MKIFKSASVKSFSIGSFSGGGFYLEVRKNIPQPYSSMSGYAVEFRLPKMFQLRWYSDGNYFKVWNLMMAA